MTGSSVAELVFGPNAYRGLIAEVHGYGMDTETGGILLGNHVGGIWYVFEHVEPGPNTLRTPVRFSYDYEYCLYRSGILSGQYAQPLKVIGLWHKQPGQMVMFSGSGEDDSANRQFAINHGGAAVSGIVTLEPAFTLTMYEVTLKRDRPVYRHIEWRTQPIPASINRPKRVREIMPIRDRELRQVLIREAQSVGRLPGVLSISPVVDSDDRYGWVVNFVDRDPVTLSIRGMTAITQDGRGDRMQGDTIARLIAESPPGPGRDGSDLAF